MREYVRRRQAKIAEYIATRPLFELCTGAERMLGSSRSVRWWEKYHIQEGCNRSKEGTEGEVELLAVGSIRDVVFRLKYCVVSVP